jgi:hypothetical protein
VLVNGQSAGLIAWEPNEIEITDLLRAGANELRFTVIGHRRNSHGPHHNNEKWPAWTGPGQFQAGADHWFEGYNLVPCGLMAGPEIRYRKTKY